MDTVKFIGIVFRKRINQVLNVFPELLVHQGGPLKLWAGKVKMSGIPDTHPILLKFLIQGRHIILHRCPGHPELLAQLVYLKVLAAYHQDQQQDGHAFPAGIYHLIAVLQSL